MLRGLELPALGFIECEGEGSIGVLLGFGLEGGKMFTN